jgi:hypothetical protein
VTSCGMVGCVLSYHTENIANFTMCYRGDLEIYKQMNVLEGGLWSDWGHDRRLCVCGRGGVILTFLKTYHCVVSSVLVLQCAWSTKSLH